MGMTRIALADFFKLETPGQANDCEANPGGPNKRPVDDAFPVYGEQLELLGRANVCEAKPAEGE